MNITLKHLRAFVAVGRAQSFTQASIKCGLSQPAVSIAVGQLEEYLEKTLLERTTRFVRLTDEGSSFMITAERIIENFDNAISNAKLGAGDDSLAIAALPSIAGLLLPDVISEMIGHSPDVRVHVRDSNASAVQRRVLAGEVDFGVTSIWKKDHDLTTSPLLDDVFGVVSGGLAANSLEQGIWKWDDFETVDVIGLAADTGIAPLLSSVPELPSSVARPRVQCSNISALTAMLKNGLGITILPYITFLSLNDPALRFIPLRQPTVKRRIEFVRRRGTKLSAISIKAQTRIKFLCQEKWGDCKYVRLPSDQTRKDQ